MKKKIVFLLAFFMGGVLLNPVTVKAEEPDIILEQENEYVEINETNFPDEKFRTWLSGCDTDPEGGDGKLSDTELQTITSINSSGFFTENPGNAYGVKNFTGIEKLKYLQSLQFNVSSAESLTLDLSQNTNLSSIIIQLYTVPVNLTLPADCSNLTTLSVNKVTFSQSALDLSACDALIDLSLTETNVSSIKFPNNKTLQSLNLNSDRNLTSIDFTKIPNLYTLNVIDVPLNAISLSNMTSLGSLTLQEVNVRPDVYPTTLKYLILKDLDLAELNVSRLTSLEGLTVSNSKIKKLDVSGHTDLKELTVNKNPLLTYLKATGSNAITNFSVSGNPKLTKIDYCSLSNIYSFDISDNDLSGSMDFSKLPIRLLSLGGNRFSEIKLNHDKTNCYYLLNLKDNELTYIDLPKDYRDKGTCYYDITGNHIACFELAGCDFLDRPSSMKYEPTSSIYLKDRSLDPKDYKGFDTSRVSNLVNLDYVNGKYVLKSGKTKGSYTYKVCDKYDLTVNLTGPAESKAEDKKPTTDPDDKKPTTDPDDKKPATDDKYAETVPEGPDSWKQKEGTDGFVYRLYNVALLREVDQAGFEDWENKLNQKTESATEVAYGFLFSEEFKNKKYSDVVFVKLLYRTFMGREADEAGLKDWVGKLENGMSREYVFSGFAGSAEFSGLCSGYGVEKGEYSSSQYRDKNEGATSYVARLYTKMLGRSFDEAGIEDWTMRYLTGSETVESIATNGFLHSEELTNMNLSNEEFVKRMYATFLDREPDEAGFNDWVNQLNTGAKTRDDLVYGFSLSQEFGNVKAKYGLK